MSAEAAFQKHPDPPAAGRRRLVSWKRRPLGPRCATLLGYSFAVAVAGLVTAASSSAQTTSFNPQIGLNFIYIDNPGFTDETGDSDSYFRLTLVLPVTFSWERTSLSLSYGPYFDRFDRFSELDNQGHRFSLGLNSTPNERSAVAFTTSFLITEDQGDPASAADEDLFLTRRSRREVLVADLSYSRAINPLWSWSASVGVRDADVTDISDFGDDQPLTEIEGRSEQRASGGFSRSLSRTLSVGGSYTVRRFDLDLSGDQTTQSLSLVASRELQSQWLLNASVGLFVSEGEAVRGRQEMGDDSESGIQGTLTAVRELRRTRIELSLDHLPSAGGIQTGTSTNTRLLVAISSNTLNRWGWGLSARYARRDPTDPTLVTDESVGVNASLTLDLNRLLGLRFSGSYIDQFSGTEASTLRLGAGVVYHPLGRTRLAGGSAP